MQALVFYKCSCIARDIRNLIFVPSSCQYFNVSSVRVCVCACVMDVTSTNEPGLRENTREDRDVIICVHS